MLVITEIFGHGQRRMTNAKPAARRFVHLAVDHHHVLQYTGRLHVAVELFAFAGLWCKRDLRSVRGHNGPR